jgi:PAS domain S-box-containing protein
MKGSSSFNGLRRRLSVMLVMLAILPTATVGWMAHDFMVEYAQAARMEGVGLVADARRDELVWLLRRANVRAKLLLSTLSSQCSHGASPNQACAVKAIRTYLNSEGAQGATLRMSGAADLTVGASAIRSEDSWNFPPEQLAKLSGVGPKDNQAYFVAVDGPANGLRLSVTYPASNLQPLFDRSGGLGDSGETFLVDAQGFFVTRARYPSTQGHEHPISAHPMQACLAGTNSQTIDLDYRDREVIHGFRLVPEIGSGCIMAHVDRAEALAPLALLEKKAAGIFAVFLLPVILVALYVASRIVKSEESRRASESKFRLLFDLANDSFTVLDMQGRIVDINRTGHERLGYAKEEMVGKEIGQFNAPEYAAKVAQRVGEVRDSGNAVVEAVHLRRDGSEFPVEVNASLVELDGQQRVFSIVRDISERKRMDRALRLIQFALDNASMMVAMMRVRDGRFIYVNDEACRSFGHSREALLGMTVFDVDPELSPERWSELNRQLGLERRAPFETTYRGRDGRMIPVEVTASVLEIDGEQYHIGFSQDVTQRRMAKETLRKSEASLRATLDNLPYRTWLKDTDSRYITINKAYAEHLQLKNPVEAVGKTDLDLHPLEVAEIYRADDRRVMHTRQQKNEEVQVVQDGQRRWLETFKTPIIDHDGKLLGTVGFARDITERKVADEQFKLMLRASLDGVWVVDMTARFQEVNDAYCELMGYTRDELLGMTITDVEADERREDTARRIEQILGAGGARFETRHRAKDGRILDVEVSVAYTPSHGGRMYCFLRDITERKRAEDALRESAEQLQSHINNSPMAFVAWDDSYRVTQWSGEAERIFGWSAADTLGKPLTDLRVVYEEDIPLVQQTMDKLAEVNSRYVVSANRNVTKDGRVIDCVWYNTVLPKKDGTMGSIMSQVLDVTEQKRAERELRESEQRFKTLAAATHEGVAITAQGRFLDVNEQLLRMLGYERRDELIGRPVLDTVAPEARERVMPNVLAGLESNLEHEMLRKDGSRVTVEAHGQTMMLDGRSIRVTAIRDTTMRRRIEEALLAAKAEAERANDAKSRFLAAASHDLRQPLSALKLYVGVLRTKLDAEDQELLVNMQDCVGGLSSLLSKLLDLSKLDAGVVTPRVRNFALDDLLHNVCAAHAPEAESKSLRLRCGYFGLTARTDSVLYQRIIGNLVANAIRYTERGGVLIGCRRREGKMWLEVWDTGVGIPHDKISEVFEEFKQLGDDARTYGSGLGLTIVAKTASLLGLRIRVQSRPSRGSMFAIELPLGKRAPTASDPKPAKLSRCVRIAVVDDNPIVLNALVGGLESAGHEVVAAPTGKDLLARLDTRAPEMLICDYRLAAGETGFDVIKSVRDEFRSDLPGIIITGDTDPKLMRSMNKKGIAILHKPVELDDLQARIEEVMVMPLGNKD